MIREITKCRICGNPNLVSLLHLGNQYMTGIFPRKSDPALTCGPLELVKCHAEDGQEHCALVQLRQSYELSMMYGDNYGYRSSLNRSMVEHLKGIAAAAQKYVSLAPGDIVLDIGSNDGTLLSFYPSEGPLLVGIDPTAQKFQQFYQPHIQRIPDFFSARLFQQHFGRRQARIITTIAMFYDLESPEEFMREIAQVLADDGLWMLEQVYLPRMLDLTAYDTICHEHLEYYALRQIEYLTARAGLKIIDVEFNEANGGSFAVAIAKAPSPHAANTTRIQAVLAEEQARGLDSLPPFQAFASKVFSHRSQLLQLLAHLKGEGKLVLGYGASTKGNVILQFCGITPRELPYIAEVNEDKFGCLTPGTQIPIISEAEARAMAPAYFLVMPWHFKNTIVQKERNFLRGGGRLIFPLPQIEII